ncbi:phosphoribosylaminoimidazole carboxylase, chloroplastic isoform X2 [Asparagus officinalis]|uniref:phosphoribosylaminoimidazole carboxylase, chloroplastic isoform X2 n=1 Tax=Asparagus officinalis TaxID=4686 RepID=UPI00098E452D|nr:phosphoribosylaminoimidazole carboxylase, chloroplastic isoform X2 [Asparagus officinalis]
MMLVRALVHPTCFARPRDSRLSSSPSTQVFVEGKKTSLSFSYPKKTRPMSSARCAISAKSSQQSSKDGEDRLSVHGVSEMVVGILGGGQLGRMLCQAASQMGIKVLTLDPLENCPASSLSHQHIVGNFNDGSAVLEFAKRCGVLTVEIEHVDVDALKKLEQQGVDCEPKASTIRIIQDKYIQKVHFSHHGIPLPDFMQIDNLKSAEGAGDLFGYPLMIKSRKLAYDGRGNAVAHSKEELSSSVKVLGGYDRGLYVERWTEFVKELAVIVGRGRDGSISCYPVVETIHRDNICHIVEAPADVPESVKKCAMDVAQKAVSSLGGAGVFAVELFLTKDGKVLLNEVAPRPHNSGHHTIESCYTSQYEQHLRAVTGLPLGDPSMKTPAAIMYNILGEDEGEPGFYIAHQLTRRALSIPGASVHWYDKPATPHVAIIMGSDSDLPVMKDAAEILKAFDVPFEITIVSAHRTPERMYSFALSARERGIRTIIAGAGGAAHLPGMVASLTPLPVIGVPVKTSSLSGVDSLYSIVQMPKGVPVATVAINNAANAGLLAVKILASTDSDLSERLMKYQEDMKDAVLGKAEKLEAEGWEKYLNP